MSTNVVVVSGRIGKAPEVKTTQSQKSVTSFSLAVDRGFGEKKKTVWLNVEAWDKTAEAIVRLTGQGKRVIVTGELDEDSWQDQQGGKRSRIKVIANRVDIIDYVEKEQTEDVPF